MTQSPHSYLYDLLICHSTGDQGWLRDDLLPRLQQASLRVLTEHRDLAANIDQEHPIWRTRMLLLVLSADTSAGRRAQFATLPTQLQARPATAPTPLVVTLDQAALPDRLMPLRRFDLASPATRPKQMLRLLRALGRKRRVFVVYQADAKPDAMLALQLSERLACAGHTIVGGQALALGARDVHETEDPLAACDCVIVLLSQRAVQSDLIAGAIEYAHQHFLQHGYPQLLPVRVAYFEPWPYQVGKYLNALPAATWRGASDSRRLTLQLCDWLGHGSIVPAATVTAPGIRNIQPPPAYADPRFIASLEAPGGVLSSMSEFYIERAADTKLRDLLERDAGTTITIRAARQTGKSSLVLRGLVQAQAGRGRPVYIDLQPIDSAYLADLNRLVYYLATTIIAELKLDHDRLDQAWAVQLPASLKLSNLMEDYILPHSGARVILALDEADRLIDAPYRDDFFSILRAWHGNRARKAIWQQLDILLVISTEPNILINDINRSPFNVGTRIDLEDFNAAQVAELNRRYHAPLTEQELPALLELLGGHPFLTALALYTLVNEPMRWPQLAQIAPADKGPFADHLRRYLWILRGQPELRQALKDIIEHGRCSADQLFFRLTQLGLVKGIDAQTCECRCGLYATYFRAKL